MSITDQTATYIAVTAADGAKPTHSHVVLDDGSEFVVRTGLTKDLVAWDRTVARKYDREKQAFIFGAFMAWNAARREGFYPGTFDGPGGFLDSADDITMVRLADEPAQPADEPVPPTPRAAPLA
jgi:hypothetical protein